MKRSAHQWSVFFCFMFFKLGNQQSVRGSDIQKKLGVEQLLGKLRDPAG